MYMYMYEAACRRGSWQTPVISRRRFTRPTTTRKGFPTAYRTGALCAAGCRLPTDDAMFSEAGQRPCRLDTAIIPSSGASERGAHPRQTSSAIASATATRRWQTLGTSLDTYGASRDSRTRDLLSLPLSKVSATHRRGLPVFSVCDLQPALTTTPMEYGCSVDVDSIIQVQVLGTSASHWQTPRDFESNQSGWAVPVPLCTENENHHSVDLGHQQRR